MAPFESNPDQFLPQVEPASLEPIINYVDGLNFALTGDFSPLRATALPGCGCLAIANRLENLFKSASLIGGNYKLASIKLEKDGQNQKSFKVVVDRSEIRRVDKFNHQSILSGKLQYGSCRQNHSINPQCCGSCIGVTKRKFGLI
jgi:hypothetical protein